MTGGTADLTDEADSVEPPATDDPAAHALRTGLIAIAAVIVVGTAVELAMQHHWTKAIQLVAWLSLILLAAAIVLLVSHPTPGKIRAVRVVAVLVALTAALGVVEHVLGNYEAGPLDAQYGESWDSMSELARWWAAFIQAVGPSPALAPGVTVLAAMCLWVATIRHPATAEPTG